MVDSALPWTPHSPAAKGRSKAGQSLIESCIIIAVMCVLFFSLFQLAHVFVAREFLFYAASRGVRARTVGFNQFMTWKTVRVGAIPNAGKLISPEFESPVSDWSTLTPAGLWATWTMGLNQQLVDPQYSVERSRIPLYLGGTSYNQLPPILDYEDWDTVDIQGPIENFATRMVSAMAVQDVPLRYPFHRLFYADDFVTMSGEAHMENDYVLYLEQFGF